MPKFEDPATIKFINKKFVLATNDPKNPVSIVRQVHKDDSSKIEIFLSNGTSYHDEINELSDLIEITSNIAAELTFEIKFSNKIFPSNMKDEIADVAKALKAIFKMSPIFGSEEFFELTKMIPRRVIPFNMEFDVEYYIVKDSYNIFDFRGDGSLTCTFYVIAPKELMVKVCDEIGDEIFNRFRRSTAPHANFYNWDFHDAVYDEIPINDVLDFSGSFTQQYILSFDDKETSITWNEFDLEQEHLKMVDDFAKNLVDELNGKRSLI